MGKASAPGKIILSGEHSVVYGYPALVSAVSLRCFAYASSLPEPGIEIISKDLEVRQIYSPTEVYQLKDLPLNSKTDNLAFSALKTLEKIGINPLKQGISISLESEIPISAGLGSSAASAVSVVGAILSLFKKSLSSNEISSLAFEGEILAHGTPSGVDNAAATYGGYLRYENGNVSKLDIANEVPVLVCNTMVPRETKALVANVRKRYDSSPNIIGQILKALGQIPNAMIDSIAKQDFIALGNLMEINQGLLDSIGVGHHAIHKVISIAKEFGALGSKLTGAGGGGCVIILPSDEDSENEIHRALKEQGFDSFRTRFSQEGVRIE